MGTRFLFYRAPLDSGFYFEAGFGGLKSASSILCPLQKVASYFNRIVFSVFQRVFLGFRPLLRWLYRLQRTKQA
jgi:hypothetical protein